MSNTPYKAAQHLSALIATGAKPSRADAWGNSPTNANYAAFDMYGKTIDDFKKICRELNLAFGWYGPAGYPPNVGATIVVAKYVKENYKSPEPRENTTEKRPVERPRG